MTGYFDQSRRANKKACVITAHPDDESLFAGGTIAEYKRWSWTIVCVTDCDRRYNKKRRRELLQACRSYNKDGSKVVPIMLSVIKRKGSFNKSEMKERIKGALDRFGPFDIIFTHGKKGDYGHKTHKFVHNAVNELKPANLYNFCMPPVLRREAGKNSNIKPECVNLSRASLCLKKEVLNIYINGSQRRNLSQLRRVVNSVLNSKKECFTASCFTGNN